MYMCSLGLCFRTEEGDLLASVTMPSIEVGTVGGGTRLAAQNSMLQLLGVAGSNNDLPGENARRLAKVIAGATLCGSHRGYRSEAERARDTLLSLRRTPFAKSLSDPDLERPMQSARLLTSEDIEAINLSALSALCTDKGAGDKGAGDAGPQK